jgi:ferritin-like metal-binding protein YciE
MLKHTHFKVNKDRMAKKGRSKTRTKSSETVSLRRKGKRLTSAQKLTLHLNEALAIENAAVQRLQSRIKQTKIKNVKQQLQVHLEETKRQQDRLKQLITGLGNGQKNAATKDKAQLPIPTPPKSLTNIFGRAMTSAESELIAAKEDAIVENAEIILYEMLTQVANRMNAANAITILSESLSEERAMADWIKTNTPDMITQLWPEIEASISMDKEEE